MTAFDHVKEQHNYDGRVEFLSLLGMPITVPVTKENTKTFLTIVFPHYMELFDGWWRDEQEDGLMLPTGNFAEELDAEEQVYPGETLYEYILSQFGQYVVENS